MGDDSRCERLGREPEPAIRCVPEEAFIDQPLQDVATLIGVELEESRRLFDGWRKAAHFDELATYAFSDVRARRRGGGATVVQRCNRERPRRDVQGRSG